MTTRSESIVSQMLRFITKVAKKARVKMAIGGGVAVQAHGYRRETSDVDAFFHYSDRQKVLRAINTLSKEYVLDEIDSSHWIAIPPGAEADERIDLMFATGDPEESAIEMAETKKYKNIPAPMFPIDMLVIAKYMANRDDAKDWMDIYTLHKRGAYDLKDITKRLRQMGLPQDAKQFVEFMSGIDAITKRKLNR